MIDETQMCNAAEHAFKEKSAKLLILLPSEPFILGHFNVRYPVSWTNWVNSDKFMDSCWISCQVMADMEIFYDNLIIINL